MATYRLKAALVEAVQWDGTEMDADRIAAHFGQDFSGFKEYAGGRGLIGFYIQTAAGQEVVAPGDWIVRRVTSGEYMTGDDAGFQEHFELVEQPPVIPADAAVNEVHDHDPNASAA